MTPLWGAGQEIETKIDGLVVDVSDLTVDVADVNTDVLDLGATTRLGSINGIDRGTIALSGATESGTATIGAVVLARSNESYLGQSGKDSVSAGSQAWSGARIGLTATTTVTATRDASDSVSNIVAYRVMEHSA